MNRDEKAALADELGRITVRLREIARALPAEQDIRARGKLYLASDSIEGVAIHVGRQTR